MILQLDADEIRELFESARVARLGCIANGEPYVVPLNYEFHDGSIYFHSLPGLKVDALRKDPRACVQVDLRDSDLQWRSALAFGKFEEVRDKSERQSVLTSLMDRYPMMTPVEWRATSDQDFQDVIVFRIRIERMTGVAGD